MAKQAFPVEELVPKPTPKACEGRIGEENQPDHVGPVKQMPEDPPDVDPIPEHQGLDVVVSGPRYGDVVVKLTDDGTMVERFPYRVIDEEEKKVVAKTDTREIPPEVNAALLKSGWFCTDWGENYTATGADYLATLGAACKELAENEEFGEDADNPELPDAIGGSMLLPGGYQPDRISDYIYDALMAVHYSKALRNGTCHENLREEIEHRVDADDTVGPTEAINQIIREQQGQDEQLTTIRISKDSEGGAGEEVMRQLNYNTFSSDVPNVCINYLPEFGPQTDGQNYWEGGLATDCYFHLPHHQIDDRYMVETELVEKDGEEILQVGVVTVTFAFYEEFKKVGEDEYLTSNASGRLPAIYCAAVVREMGGEIKNLPSLDEPSIEELYLAIAEVVVKIFKNDSGLHKGTLQKLNDVTSTIQAQAMSETAEMETVDQEDLPAGATGDGQRTVFSREQFNDGLISRLPNSMDKLDDAAGGPAY